MTSLEVFEVFLVLNLLKVPSLNVPEGASISWPMVVIPFLNACFAICSSNVMMHLFPKLSSLSFLNPLSFCLSPCLKIFEPKAKIPLLVSLSLYLIILMEWIDGGMSETNLSIGRISVFFWQ